jgi:hypothetical protein
MVVLTAINHGLQNRTLSPDHKRCSQQFLFLLFKAFNVSFINLKIASSVAMTFLKPNWFRTSNLLVLRCAASLLNRAYSKTFGKEINSDIGL